VLGLDIDSQGFLYTQDHDSGAVYKIDPMLGSVQTIGNNGAGMAGIAVGFDPFSGQEVPFYSVLMAMGADTSWLFKQTDAGAVIWTRRPAGVGVVLSGTFYAGPGGVSFNVDREAFSIDLLDNRVFRHVDVNQDGYALELDETIVFGTLPIPDQSGGILGIASDGLAVTVGGGVLVNVRPGGVYWLIDRDPAQLALNGVDQTDDVTLYSAQHVANVVGTGDCLTAPRR
jgi:hypothetical protein